MNIPKTILEKYKLKSLEDFKSGFGKEFEEKGIEIFYLTTFLERTDHIPNKIIEAQAMNKNVDDYSEILALRQEARNRINELGEEIGHE